MLPHQYVRIVAPASLCDCPNKLHQAYVVEYGVAGKQGHLQIFKVVCLYEDDMFLNLYLRCLNVTNPCLVSQTDVFHV